MAAAASCITNNLPKERHDLAHRSALIAILRGITPPEALDHVGALIDAGFDAIEIPLNSPDWAISLRSVVAAFGEQA